MGAHQSKTGGKTKSHTKLAHTSHKQNDTPHSNSERPDAEIHGSGGLQPEHLQRMFSSRTPAGVVGRLKGWKYVHPFTTLMQDWTHGEWPMVGSFEADKLKVVKMNMDPTVGNAVWSYPYMKECVQVWMSVANQRNGMVVCKEEKISDELRSVIEETAERVNASLMPLLEAGLQTRAAEMMKIKQKHADDVKACAKAMFYGWVKRQSRQPVSPQDFQKVLSECGMSEPERAVVNCPKLGVSTELPQRVIKNDDDLILHAAAMIQLIREREQASVGRSAESHTSADTHRQDEKNNIPTQASHSSSDRTDIEKEHTHTHTALIPNSQWNTNL